MEPLLKQLVKIEATKAQGMLGEYPVIILTWLNEPGEYFAKRLCSTKSQATRTLYAELFGVKEPNIVFAVTKNEKEHRVILGFAPLSHEDAEKLAAQTEESLTRALRWALLFDGPEFVNLNPAKSKQVFTREGGHLLTREGKRVFVQETLLNALAIGQRIGHGKLCQLARRIGVINYTNKELKAFRRASSIIRHLMS